MGSFLLVRRQGPRYSPSLFHFSFRLFSRRLFHMSESTLYTNTLLRYRIHIAITSEENATKTDLMKRTRQSTYTSTTSTKIYCSFVSRNTSIVMLARCNICKVKKKGETDCSFTAVYKPIKKILEVTLPNLSLSIGGNGVLQL